MSDRAIGNVEQLLLTFCKYNVRGLMRRVMVVRLGGREKRRRGVYFRGILVYLLSYLCCYP